MPHRGLLKQTALCSSYDLWWSAGHQISRINDSLVTELCLTWRYLCWIKKINLFHFLCKGSQKLQDLSSSDFCGVIVLGEGGELDEKLESFFEHRSLSVTCMYPVSRGSLLKGSIRLPTYRCARGSTSLESFHLHLNRFIPGKSQFYLCDFCCCCCWSLHRCFMYDIIFDWQAIILG